MILHHPARKRMSSRSEELDRELAEGVVRQQERKVMVNGHLIRQQGQIIQQRLNRSLPMDKQLGLKFSNGWLDKFCHRHSFRQHLAHREAGSESLDDKPSFQLLAYII